jgi:hypothetical protein
MLALLLALAFLPARATLLDLIPPSWRIVLMAWRDGVTVDHSVVVQMPDGVRLRASLYRPRNASGSLPTVLIRLPYHRLRFPGGFLWALHFARNGHAVLVQDLRGTGDSGGELLPWRDAGTDGAATLDWIARQPWSTGKVGTFGCSALGETQFALARMRHPAHRAMIASGAGGAVGDAAGRYSYFGLFEGGVFELASGFGWFVSNGSRDPRAARASPFDLATHLRKLPVSGLVENVRPAPNGFSDFLATPLSDSRWSNWGYVSASDHATVPALIINTWGDQTVGDTLALAEAWRGAGATAAAHQKVVIAPGNHCGHADWGSEPKPWGALLVENAARPYSQWYLDWFNYWLRDRGDGLRDLKPFNFFMLTENRWLGADAWPPGEARTERWYLGSSRRANSRLGDGFLSRRPVAGAPFDGFVYDPMSPVPSRGGPLCCTGDPHELPGPTDQADVENREDVLVYTSEPLGEDLRMAGPLRASLVVSSSAVDTDLVTRLVHVWPDGKATNVQEGALRLRYRSGFLSPVRMEPGRRYEVVVDMRSIAYTIPRGHRFRLHVTSSSFPRLERNLNTGSPNNANETRSLTALNRVYHDADAASFLELPVLPTPRP